jgi:hypothetical protein
MVYEQTERANGADHGCEQRTRQGHGDCAGGGGRARGTGVARCGAIEQCRGGDYDCGRLRDRLPLRRHQRRSGSRGGARRHRRVRQGEHPHQQRGHQRSQADYRFHGRGVAQRDGYERHGGLPDVPLLCPADDGCGLRPHPEYDLDHELGVAAGPRSVSRARWRSSSRPRASPATASARDRSARK